MDEQAPKKRGRPPKAVAPERERRPVREITQHVNDDFTAHWRAFCIAANLGRIEEMDRLRDAIVAILDHARGA
jgi:hypothetical protein